MPRAATETFAACPRGPHPAALLFAGRTRPQHGNTSRLASALLALSALLPPLFCPAADSENPVPFPRAVQISDSAHGPPPFPLLAQLGTTPDWSELDAYHDTMLREEFEKLLGGVYAANDDAWREHIRILPDRALIRRQSNWPAAGWIELRFRDPAATSGVDVPRYWKAPSALRPALDPARPLADLHILVDPGHIGGEFARTEGRWYQIGAENDPVMEGEMSLRVARILERDLSLLGARVSLSRGKNAPVTLLRPHDLIDDARDYFLRRARTTKPLLPRAQVESLAYKFFYLSSEIRTRAEHVNERLQPDLALCLHFNAEAWGNPSRPRFKRSNHFHILVNGCYSAGEIAEDDQRLELLHRLLQRVHYYETGMADEIADAMARETRLPPMAYNTPNARKVGDHPAVWARDLLANRKFLCPVVFFEPYIMNNREVHDRVQAGEYRGLREFNGVYKKNIYQEYADAITTGLVNYFRAHRK